MSLAGLTAWQSLMDAGKLKTGQRVLINGGTGAVGIWAVQIGKALGCFVAATCSAEKADMVKKLGADETIDYKQDDLYQKLAQQYGAEDKRFDVVFDVGLRASLMRYGLIGIALQAIGVPACEAEETNI